ncbi:RNA-guided endonuclease InsQ/TnpB family protein [Hymenobacter montanus]|uniref:RNA-guided endonuclease InsQ/TnpB family protein n=1 Tax=Hymenobacter montanus TaxID=2771359 RepID=UPI001CC2EDE8|nr:RNA-guided endonuclease TnpB family protein [Hymenobacter montanus]
MPDLKTECPWLKLVNSQSLQMALRNLDNTFTNFLKGRGDYPNFRRKANGGSFQIPANGQVDFEKGTISLPKFKSGIKAVLHRRFKGTVKTVTIRRTPTGKFFASVLVDPNQQAETLVPPTPDNVVGIDLGIKDFLVTSEGEAVANPKHLRKNIARLKVLQRRASRKPQAGASHIRRELGRISAAATI